MNLNKEIKGSKGDQQPDCVQSENIQNEIASSTNEEASEVGCAGTTFVSEDWGPDPLDSDDDVESWGTDGDFNENVDFADVWEGEIKEKAMKGAMSNDNDEVSWEDKRSSVNPKKSCKNEDVLIDWTENDVFNGDNDG